MSGRLAQSLESFEEFAPKRGKNSLVHRNTFTAGGHEYVVVGLKTDRTVGIQYVRVGYSEAEMEAEARAVLQLCGYYVGELWRADRLLRRFVHGAGVEALRRQNGAACIGRDLDDRVRRRAYEIWKGEGEPHGREKIHWVRAEAEFREAMTLSRRPPLGMFAYGSRRNFFERCIPAVEPSQLPVGLTIASARRSDEVNG